MEALKGFQEEIKRMTETINGNKNEEMQTFLKLKTVPQTQKSINVNGTMVLVQLYDDNVRVVFPTSEMTKQYYDDINKPVVAECWLKKYFKWSK